MTPRHALASLGAIGALMLATTTGARDRRRAPPAHDPGPCPGPRRPRFVPARPQSPTLARRYAPVDRRRVVVYSKQPAWGSTSCPSGAPGWISATSSSCRGCWRSPSGRSSIFRTATRSFTTSSRSRRRTPSTSAATRPANPASSDSIARGLVPGVLRHPLAHERVHPGLQPPFFAVTDDDGRYAIRRVPAGTYTLIALERAGDRRAAPHRGDRRDGVGEWIFRSAARNERLLVAHEPDLHRQRRPRARIDCGPGVFRERRGDRAGQRRAPARPGRSGSARRTTTSPSGSRISCRWPEPSPTCRS